MLHAEPAKSDNKYFHPDDRKVLTFWKLRFGRGGRGSELASLMTVISPTF